MAGAQIPLPLRFSGWPRGIWNKGREESLPLTEVGQQTALRGAVNVDLDDSGKPQRRPGFSLVEAVPGLHSLWSHPRFPLMLGAASASLVAYDGYAVESTPSLTGPADERVDFALGADAVYFSSLHDCGAVSAAGDIVGWAAEHPGGQPAAAVDPAVGGLDAGTYQVAVTFVDADGRESGATLPVEVDVPSGGGIRLSQFPTPTRADTRWVRVYCSHPNGEVLYQALELAAPASAAIIGVHTPGAQLKTLFLSELPPGQCVAFHAGTLHVGRGNVHLWGEPLMHGLTRRSTNYARYDADLALIAGVGQGEGSGIYVVVSAAPGRKAGRTYYLSGPTPKDWSRAIAYPHGAVPGTLTYVLAKDLGLEVKGEVPVWFTDHGQLVAGLPGGAVQELHDATYDGPQHAAAGGVAMRYINGVKHMIAVLRGGAAAGFAASDSADAEVWKGGVRVR